MEATDNISIKKKKIFFPLFNEFHLSTVDILTFGFTTKIDLRKKKNPKRIASNTSILKSRNIDNQTDLHSNNRS